MDSSAVSKILRPFSHDYEQKIFIEIEKFLQRLMDVRTSILPSIPKPEIPSGYTFISIFIEKLNLFSLKFITKICDTEVEAKKFSVNYRNAWYIDPLKLIQFVKDNPKYSKNSRRAERFLNNKYDMEKLNDLITAGN